MTELVTCRHCGEAKAPSEFRPDGRHGSGCMECYRASRRQKYQENREQIRAQQAEYRAKNRDKILEQRRLTETPERKAAWRANYYQTRYGISTDERDALLAAQGGVCAIPGCGADDPGMGKGWATDHDHACCPEVAKSCGECIRGILCNPCNMMLGISKDDEARLLGAIQYLRESSARRAVPAA